MGKQMKRLSKQEIKEHCDLWTEEFIKEKFKPGFTHIPTIEEFYVFYSIKIIELSMLRCITDFLIPMINKRQNLIAKYKLIMRY
jgi:hypothetical protein